MITDPCVYIFKIADHSSPFKLLKAVAQKNSENTAPTNKLVPRTAKVSVWIFSLSPVSHETTEPVEFGI